MTIARWPLVSGAKNKSLGLSKVGNLMPHSNSLPNDKILGQYKLKALAGNTKKVNKKLKLVLGRVENILRNGENAGYQHFLLFPKCFQNQPSSESLKVW